MPITFEEWEAERQPISYVEWEQDNISQGVQPPMESTPEMLDLAYDRYVETLRATGTGQAVKGWSREAFKSSGQAAEWIKTGSTRTPRSYAEGLSEAYRRGQEGFFNDQEYFSAVLSGDNAVADKLYDQHKKMMARDAVDPIGTDGNLLSKASYGTARILPGMIEGGKQAVPWIAAGGTAAAVGGQFGPQVALPEEILTVPAAMGIGFKVGATHAWYKQGAGQMMKAMRDKGLDNTSSKVIASIAALPYALIEQSQIGMLVPGVRQGANKVIQKTMSRVLARAVVKYGTTFGSEVAEEVMQEGVAIIAEDLASYFEGQGINITEEELKNRAWRLWNTGKEAAVSMMLLPIPGAAVDIRAGYKGRALAGKFEDAGYNKTQAASMAGKIDTGLTINQAHRAVVNETISDSHKKNSGSSISQRSGRPITKGFPVGVGFEETIDGEVVSPDDIDRFRNVYQEELNKPGREIGTWYNEEDKKSYISVVQIAETQEEAMQLGRDQGEIAVYNLETGETIPLEVTSETKTDETVRKVPVTEKDEFINDFGASHGLTYDETTKRLDNAEVRFQKLSEKSKQQDLSFHDQKELDFLGKKRGDVKAILERESAPKEGVIYSKKEIMDRVHNLSDMLGYDLVKRRALQQRITGKDSLTKMLPVQREQVMMFLEREAKEQGANIEDIDTTPVGELMAKMRERKQKPALTNRDRRQMSTLRKVLHDIKRGVSYYFLNSSRIRRIARALDNYEENGPFQRYIFRTVRQADVEANLNFTAVMESMRSAMDQLDIDGSAMMTEIVDIGIEDKLTTSQRIGVYALSKNEKTMNHLLSEFSKEEIGKIAKSVESDPDAVMVANEIGAYFEHGWPEFEAIAKAAGIKGLVKEENYITAFVADRDGLDEPDFTQGLTEMIGESKKIPGQERAMKRKPGAKRQLELDIFVIHARAAKSIERFKVMAPIAKRVGSIMNHQGFKKNLNDATYGHGTKLMQRWLQDSIRGKAAYDNAKFAPMFRWLRTSSMNYVLGWKILVAGKQGISALSGMSVHPKMVPLVMANLGKIAKPGNFTSMHNEATGKSGLLKTRDWNRDLRATYNKKQVARVYKGKSLSPAAMKMAQYIDKRVTTAVWYSAYQLSSSQGMNEKESIQFADGVIQDTQPMGSAVDLPAFFRGGEFEKTLTIFQNQVNQNGNILWYDILGEKRGSKINYQMAAYRLMVSQILPAYLLGMITRGRPSTDPKEIAVDMFSYFVSPFVFVGRFVFNIATGEWGRTGSIVDAPFTETGRFVRAVKRGEGKKSLKYGARTIGAWSGGKIPLQAITTAEGAWDLATDVEDTDFRNLVWSRYALTEKKSREKSKGPKVTY